jgi:RNA polymerase sigma-70 factor, ECF subfamily
MGTASTVLSRQTTAEEFESAAIPHIDDLFRTAVRMVGNRSEAEDVVQETYLQAWKSFHRFEPGTNCRAWLFKIMFHVTQHHRRKRFSFNLKSTRDDEASLDETLVYEPPVPQQVSDEEVLMALDKIPDRYREVILLADVEEFTYKEVADTLEIPIGTVMSRLNRGRKLLRVGLAEFAAAYGIREAIEASEGAHA